MPHPASNHSCRCQSRFEHGHTSNDLESPATAANLEFHRELEQLFRWLNADVVWLVCLVKLVQLMPLALVHVSILAKVPGTDDEDVALSNVLPSHALEFQSF